MFPIEKTIYFAILAGALLLTCIIIYFIFSVYKHQRKVIVLQQQYFLNEINILEKERARMARDLHDSIGSTLTVMQLLLHDVTGATEKETKAIQKSNQHLTNLLVQLSQINRNLTPTSLLQKGLRFYLEDLKDSIETGTRIKLDLNYQISDAIDASFSIHIYRIIQEMVNNTLKYACASSITIQLKEYKKNLFLYYQDNGVGFSVNEASNKGLGLNSIRSRTNMLGGKVQLQSGPEGTSYYFQIPLN